jgi:hypothetical protein
MLKGKEIMTMKSKTIITHSSNMMIGTWEVGRVNRPHLYLVEPVLLTSEEFTLPLFPAKYDDTRVF